MRTRAGGVRVGAVHSGVSPGGLVPRVLASGGGGDEAQPVLRSGNGSGARAGLREAFALSQSRQTVIAAIIQQWLNDGLPELDAVRAIRIVMATLPPWTLAVPAQAYR